MTNPKPCPECGQKNLFVTTTKSGGGYGPMLLPGLGGFFADLPTFEVVVCADCGLTRFFASDKARSKLPTAKKWSRS
jgi:hypothetical protein